MTTDSGKFIILHRDTPIAWFVRRNDANEMLCQLEWETGPGVYTLRETKR